MRNEQQNEKGNITNQTFEKYFKYILPIHRKTDRADTVSE